MSMNLVCSHLNLIQTLSYITYLCLYSNLDKKIKSPWQTVMQKYLLWITNEFGNKQQDWNLVEDQKIMFEDAIKTYKKLKFNVR